MLVVGSAIYQPHNVHGAVADVCHHHGTDELTEVVVFRIIVHQRYQSCIALWEYAAINQMNGVLDVVKVNCTSGLRII